MTYDVSWESRGGRRCRMRHSKGSGKWNLSDFVGSESNLQPLFGSFANESRLWLCFGIDESKSYRDTSWALPNSARSEGRWWGVDLGILIYSQILCFWMNANDDVCQKT